MTGFQSIGHHPLMGVEDWSQLLGWCLVINVGLYLFSVVVVLAAGERVAGWHAKLFGIESGTVRKFIYLYLALFKILIVFFNFVPWLALQMVGS